MTSHPIPNENSQRFTLITWLAVLFTWLFILTSWVPHARVAPESVGGLDPLALSKVATRIAALGLLVPAILILRNRYRSESTLTWLIPFGVYIGWAVVSTLWSPLKTVSLGQSFSLFVLWLLAATIAYSGRSLRDVSLLLAALTGAMLIFCVISLLSYFVFPGSGKGRFAMWVAHPATIAATASLGFVLLLACRMLWGWMWTRYVFLPGAVIYCLTLYVAVDRTCILLTAMISFCLVVALAPRSIVAALAVSLGLVGPIYLAIDPGFEATAGVFDGLGDYLMRGQSARQLSALSGRAELFDVIWDEYTKSPVMGHGYFVTSEAGAIHAWHREANIAAHNTLFQILVSTGLIGLVLYLAAIIAPCYLALSNLTGTRDANAMAILLLLVVLWAMAWGIPTSGIAAQVAPPSVAFFAVLGLAMGHLSRLSRQRQRVPGKYRPSSGSAYA